MHVRLTFKFETRGTGSLWTAFIYLIGQNFVGQFADVVLSEIKTSELYVTLPSLIVAGVKLRFSEKISTISIRYDPLPLQSMTFWYCTSQFFKITGKIN